MSRPRKATLYRLATLALPALLAACSAAPSGSYDPALKARITAARAALADDLEACTARHPFDPESTDLPENGVAPDELAWRDCAYDAARSYVAVNTALALDYATLIDQDREATAALAAGEITRSERDLRMAPLLKAVQDKEAAQMEALGDAPQSRATRAHEAYEMFRLLP